jgi:multidrug efflux pump subunit AcrA (membrane-fusion protein)
LQLPLPPSPPTPRPKPPTKKVDAPKPALTVTTTRPTSASLPIKLAANGNVAAWQEASVSSESNGLRLTEVRVNVGDVVKAGDVLAVFSSETVNADLAQARPPCTKPKPMPPMPPPTRPRPHAAKLGALSAQQISQYNTAEQPPTPASPPPRPRWRASSCA